jgi:hypothetical protein
MFPSILIFSILIIFLEKTNFSKILESIIRIKFCQINPTTPVVNKYSLKIDITMHAVYIFIKIHYYVNTFLGATS